VVVAVVAVGVVEAALVEVVEVVAVRHPLVAAAVVLAVAGDRGAPGRVGGAHFQDVLVVMAVVRRVQVAVVEVIDVPVMADAGVAAVLAVDVAVRVVGLVAHHLLLTSGQEH
jgi:hypothetical protein